MLSVCLFLCKSRSPLSTHPSDSDQCSDGQVAIVEEDYVVHAMTMLLLLSFVAS